MDDFGLAGKRVIATGASRSIGRAIAEAFARNGAHVSVCGRDEAALEETRAACAGYGVKAQAAVCDVADAEALKAYVESAAAWLGGVDILVNNATAFARREEDAAWEKAFETDLMGVVRATRAALPYLQKSGEGAIVHISSISGLKPAPGAIPYGALKAAIVQVTKSQAWVFAKDGIRVNSVAPGAITAPGHTWEHRREKGDPVYAQTLAKIPFGRMGTPDEIADATVFLASPRARWITGQTLVVDGGQTLSP